MLTPLTSTPNPGPSGTSSIAFLLAILMRRAILSHRPPAVGYSTNLASKASQTSDGFPLLVRSPPCFRCRGDARPPARAKARAGEALWRGAAGPGRRHRGAGRRRADAADAPSQHAPRHADLRHESRHRRLPDEHLPAQPACRSGSGRRAQVTPDAAAHARHQHARPAPRGRSPINEVSLLRSSRQTARIAVSVDGTQRLPDLYCDGALVATPAGSTAYNLSAHGPILPLGAGPAGADADQRLPAAALARRAAAAPFQGRVHRSSIRASGRSPPPPNSVEIANVAKVIVTEATDIDLTLLFDPEHDLEERILKEQFDP